MSHLVSNRKPCHFKQGKRKERGGGETDATLGSCAKHGNMQIQYFTIVLCHENTTVIAKSVLFPRRLGILFQLLILFMFDTS